MGWITSDNGLPSEPALINADTLGGIAADEYATISNIPTDLAELNQDSTHRLVTDSEKQTWNNKSDFDGNYNNLTNKPTMPKTVHAHIHFVDVNYNIIDGVNNNRELGPGYWEVEFILKDNGDLYLPYDLTIYLDKPSLPQELYKMFIEFPDGPYTFSAATGSGMFACMSIWTASGSYNTTNEQLVFIYPNEEVNFGFASGYKLTMVRGWWGRLADV